MHSVSDSPTAGLPQTQPQNIAIAGAGLLGRLLAWRLLLTGHKVTLFEQSSFASPVSAAHTAAAMISPMSEVVVSERAIYDMGMHSLALWPEWLEALKLNTPSDVYYNASGSLVVAHPHDARELTQFYQELNFHLGAENQARWLNKRELSQLEPDIAGQFEEALFLPDEAFLDNRALLQTLLEAIQSLGGRCIDQTEIRFSPAPGCNGELLCEFDQWFDCRGMGARQSRPDLRGVRGEVLWLQTEEITLNHAVRLMHPRYKLYVVPKPGQRFIIGATEIESEDRSPVSVQSVMELCSALYTLNPAFAEARIIETDVNLRPSYMDNLPAIEDSRVELDNGTSTRVIRINGLYRHGYLLAPHLVHTVLNQFHQTNPVSL